MSPSEEIARALEILGIEQQELAARLHVSTRTMMRWKKGETEPSGAVLELLRRILAERKKRRTKV